MGSINGDTALWRAGVGNYLNYLGTLDDDSYAMPVAVVFQRNLGVYSPNLNPLGSASPTVNNSGVLASAATDAQTVNLPTLSTLKMSLTPARTLASVVSTTLR